MHVESMKDFSSENAADQSASFSLHVSIKNHKGRKVGRKKMCVSVHAVTLVQEYMKLGYRFGV